MKYIFLFSLLLTLPSLAFAQVSNPDSLFGISRELAYSNKYEAAEKICKELVVQHPSNIEYQLFLGRIYSWQKRYDEAKEILRKVHVSDPLNEEALEALVDAELWSSDYSQVILRCDEGLKLNPKSENFMLKRAKALMLSGKFNEALTQTDELLHKDAQHKDAQNLRAEILDKRMKNKISLSYLNIAFNNPGGAPWHFAYLEYKRDLKKCPVLGRFNYGHVLNDDAVQLEVDAYPKLGKKTYLYLNTGYSPGTTVFPSVKGGAEIYQGLPKAFEVSLGARYMLFNTENVFIYTGYLGKYYKNWWFAYRPYVVAPQGNTYTTHTATIRRYLGSSDAYVSLNLIYGAAPYIVSFIQDITRTNAERIGADAQFKIWKTYFIKMLFMYEYEEYYPELYHNRFDTQVILSKRF